MSRFVREVMRGDQEETPRRQQSSEVRPDIAAALALQRSAGNAAVARRIARGRATRPMLQREELTIVQHGEMSGDQFQVAAALLADPELRIYLLGNTVPGPRDKANQIYDFYTRLTGISTDRVHLELITGDASARTKEILSSMRDPKWAQQTASVGQATNILKTAFRKDKGTTKKVREAWMATAEITDEEIERIIRSRNIPTDGPIAVLWSRQSGALGGLHPDLDSSYTGIAQLAERFESEGYAVLVVGDDPDKKIVSPFAREAYMRAVRLGEFWGRDLKGKPRTAQFKFFEHLRQLATTMVHVGMRSGNLEAYAYMGHRVLFIEERDRSDAGRMQKLVGVDTALKYRTVKVDELPTRTGRALMGATPGELLDDAKYGKPKTEGDRFAGYREFHGLLDKLRFQQKTLEKGVAEDATTKQKRDRESLLGRLGASELGILKRWMALGAEDTPAHQQALKEYQFLKTSFPELSEATGDKGFSKEDLDRIVGAAITPDIPGVNTAKGVFWCVSVPENQVAAFVEERGKDEQGAKWIGKDGQTYVVGEIREERERISSQGTARVEKTKVYDLIRQPTSLDESPVTVVQ